MTHNERGSATLHSLFAAVLLITALTAATLWSATSTARHKLTTAADLTALSAAQSLNAEPVADPSTTNSGATTLNATSPTAAGSVTTTEATAPSATGPSGATTRSTAPGATGSTGATTGTTASSATGSARAAAPSSTAPCAVAARIAAIHKVHLTACTPTPTSVTIEVSLQLHLLVAHPTLTARSRAGPL